MAAELNVAFLPVAYKKRVPFNLSTDGCNCRFQGKMGLEPSLFILYGGFWLVNIKENKILW